MYITTTKIREGGGGVSRGGGEGQKCTKLGHGSVALGSCDVSGV
jgi:hypothetical protein